MTNNHLNPLFRDILNAAASPECKECKILLSVAANSGHGRRCSQYVAPPPVPYGADGFVRTASGHIAGFATGNTVPRVAAIGNGLFVRVGTGRKRRAA